MILNRHIAPATELVDGIRAAEPEMVKLDNGIPVYLINSSMQDLVKIELLFDAGKWHENKPLVATFTNKMLREGTHTITSKALADRIDFYGAHLETSSDKDMGYVTLYCLNKHLKHTLPVLTDVIMNPSFPTEEVETLRQNKRQRFTVNKEKVRFLAKRQFNSLIYGSDHPYGKTFEMEDFDLINREDLMQFHESNYTAENCRIIAAGNIKSDFIPMLNEHFSQFRFGTSTEDGKETATAPKEQTGGKQKYHKADAVQSAIRIGRLLFNKTHEDYARMKILNTVLGGYFGSRLMTNIREDKGYTYGIGSAVVSLQQSGYFFISSEVGADVTGDALNEVYFEIDKLQQDLIPSDELSLVKNYMLGSFLRNLDGAFALSENYKGLLEYGLDYTFVNKFIDVIKIVTSEELRDLARKYLDKSQLTELTVGK